jgi:hypothetical protein
MLMSQSEKDQQLQQRQEFLAKKETQLVLADEQYKDALSAGRNSTNFKNAERNYKDLRSDVGGARNAIKETQNELTHEELARCKQENPAQHARLTLLSEVAVRPAAINDVITKSNLDLPIMASLHVDSQARGDIVSKIATVSALNECKDETAFIKDWVNKSTKSWELLHKEMNTLQECKAITPGEAKQIKDQELSKQMGSLFNNLKADCKPEAFREKLTTLKDEIMKQPKTNTTKDFLSDAESKIAKAKTSNWLGEKKDSIKSFFHSPKADATTAQSKQQEVTAPKMQH